MLDPKELSGPAAARELRRLRKEGGGSPELLEALRQRVLEFEAQYAADVQADAEELRELDEAWSVTDADGLGPMDKVITELSLCQLLKLIPEAEIDPMRRSGVPVLQGTRFPLYRILSELAADHRMSDLAGDYCLDVPTLKGFLEGLARLFDRPVV